MRVKFHPHLGVMLLLLMSIVVSLSGCSQQAMLDGFTSKPDKQTALEAIHDLQTGHLDALLQRFDPTEIGADAQAKLKKMVDMLPSGKPLSHKLVGAWHMSKLNGDNDGKTSRLIYEYQYPGHAWVLITVTQHVDQRGRMITGMWINPLTDSVEHANRFTLYGKGPGYFAMLAAVIGVPLLVLYALIRCIRTPMRRRKWLWIVFILFGVTSLSLNWTTGALHFNLLTIQLFGAGAQAQLYSPWILSVGLPVGAIVFLLKRRSLMRSEESSTTVQDEAAPDSEATAQ
ncbi:hypothetical protein [Oleiagrimonas sp. MCCC 1A03011]|uniref:hypothetical protein n=1 Tax=Oleiagrimonas sp. MCCC 1A03011 TaxID=1926883 RepID=UPI00197CE879|nr:hypothetical protein [Oleiagrimonas sp. MCCC 1A03011]